MFWNKNIYDFDYWFLRNFPIKNLLLVGLLFEINIPIENKILLGNIIIISPNIDLLSS